MNEPDDEQLSNQERLQHVIQLKKDKLKKNKNKNKNILSKLDGPGHPVNVRKSFDPEAARGVITNPTHTWEVELPTEHIGNEKDGALCGRMRDGGNIYTSPGKATCKRCISAYKRARRKNRKIPPIRTNLPPRLTSEGNLAHGEINMLEKIFYSAISAWLAGRPTNIKIKGSRAELRTLSNALSATKSFQAELQNPNATIESIITKMTVKNAATQQFQRDFGIDWPL